jgi:hypothetical protein
MIDNTYQKMAGVMSLWIIPNDWVGKAVKWYINPHVQANGIIAPVTISVSFHVPCG